jgi:hypothetical protein
VNRGHEIGVVWDVHLTQQGVTEFFLAEKEWVMNTHKQLKRVWCQWLLIKALLFILFRKEF